MQVTTVQELLAGFTDNLYDEEIDENIRFFIKTAKQLHVKDYSQMGVVICSCLCELPTDTPFPYIMELNNGRHFVYTKDEETAEQLSEILKEMEREYE